MPRKSNARAQLTDAALELIWGNSYAATSVDAICAKARVKKGSFYYFFQSKSDLAVEALEASWISRKELLDGVFSPETPPLARIARYLDGVVERQAAQKKKCGSVLGCPTFSLGCEISTRDAAICAKVREVLERNLHYFETAIRDAHEEGAICAPDAKSKARLLFAMYQGMLTQARIENSVELLFHLKPGAFELLGVPQLAAAA